MKILNKIAAIYLLLFPFVPFMQLGNIFRVAEIGFLFIWITTIYVIDKLFFVKLGNLLIICLFYLISAFYLNYLYYNNILTSFTNILQFIIALSVFFVSKYYINNEVDFFKKLFPYLLCIIIIFSILTIHVVIIDPYACRIANSEWLEERYNPWAGTYGYIYMCVFLEPLILFLILNKIKIYKWNILLYITFITNFVLILMSGYMIAISLNILFCLVTFLYYKKNILLSFIVIVSLFILFIYKDVILNDIFNFLINKFENNLVYYDKLVDFKLVFLNNNYDGYTVHGRVKNYNASIRMFLDAPILGAYFSNKVYGGGHSAFLDNLGRYGILFGSIWLYFFLFIPHNMFKRKKTWNFLDYMILVLNITFFIIDPFFQEISLAVFYFLPLTLFYYNEKIMSEN